MERTYTRTVVCWTGGLLGDHINTRPGRAGTDFQREETRYIAHKTQLSLQLESSFPICPVALISRKLMAFRVEDEENVENASKRTHMLAENKFPSFL